MGVSTSQGKIKKVKILSLTSCNTAAECSGPKALDLILCHLRTISSANFASILGISSGSSSAAGPSANNNGRISFREEHYKIDE